MKEMKKNNTKGMTIVEVMVAFFVLLIAMSGLYKATIASSNMIEKSIAVQKSVDALTEYYYTSTPNKTYDLKLKVNMEGTTFDYQWQALEYSLDAGEEGKYYMHGIADTK